MGSVHWPSESGEAVTGDVELAERHDTRPRPGSPVPASANDTRLGGRFAHGAGLGPRPVRDVVRLLGAGH